MRHKQGNKKLSKATDQRLALIRSLSQNLIKYGQIKTTLSRAYETKKMMDRIITTAKSDNLAARRQISKIINDKKLLKNLFVMAKEKYSERPGGYTRIIRLGYRRGDNTPFVLIELV